MTDVIVVGAGPAGSVAAREVARAGASVALIDGSHPREKACGGGVTLRAAELAGVALQGGLSIDAVNFEAGGRIAPVDLPDDSYLRVFARTEFDAALVRQAEDAGARLISSRVTALTRRGRRWRVSTAEGDVEAPWLLGADGVGGIVRKHVFRPFARAQLSIAAGSYVDGVETREIAIAFVDDPRGYLWSFPRRDHLAVGTCAQADEASTAQMHAVTEAWLDRYAPAAGKPRRRYAWPIPSLSSADLDREQPSGEGWMLVGDAAGLVDPITREGIYFAIRSGALAAAALHGTSPAGDYAAAVAGEIHPELRRAARLKVGFYQPRFTRLLIDALQRSEPIQQIMIELIAGRQPYAGLRRRLLRTFDLGLMLRLLRSRTAATKAGHAAS